MPETNLTIVIPALNEKERLEEALFPYLEFYKKEKADVLVIDNGSTDGTVEFLEELSQRYANLQYEVYSKPLGKGGAVYAGFAKAETEFVGFVDADISTSPIEFDKLVAAISRDESDVVIGSRWMEGAIMEPNQPLMRRINGRLFNLYVNILFGLGISDTQCGAKVLKRGVYEDVRESLLLKGFSFDVELLWRIKAKGYSIQEVPIRWKYIEGHTFSPFKSGIRAVKELARLRFI